MAGTVIEGERQSSSITVESIGNMIANPPSAEPTLTNKFSASAGAAAGGLIVSVIADLVPGGQRVRSLIDAGITAAQAAAEAEEKQNTYIQGIKYMADRNVPGFIFHETQINGENVQIAVDARSLLEKDKKEVWLWTSSTDTQNPQLKEALEATRNKAAAQIMEFDQTTRSNFDQRKADYVQALRQYAQQVEATATQPEMDVMKFPPTFKSTPTEVLDERISTEYQEVLKVGYSEEQKLPPPVQIIRPPQRDLSSVNG